MATDEPSRPIDADADATYQRVKEVVLASTTAPLATYRVQLNHTFRFEDARRRVDYLARLGVSDLYVSPILKAIPGSMHGYDLVDHTQINPELGSQEDFAELSAELKRRGMGLLLDTVPNHMGIATANPAWTDVLENGPSSLFARFFDIDWDPVKDELRGKVLLPILGDQYGQVLERGELQLTYADGAFNIRYFDNVFPLGPRGYGEVIQLRLDHLEQQLPADDLDLVELKSIATAVSHLPTERPDLARADVEMRAREKEVIKRRLAALSAKNPVIAEYLQANVKVLNGTPGEARSFDALDRLLTLHCSYRLAHWRVAGEEINYRRFFDINALAAVRVEDPEVFETAHALIFRWVAEEKVNGLRIDHPDGLFDPTAYFLNLQERYFLEKARGVLGPVSAEHWEASMPKLRERWRAEVENDRKSPLRNALYVVVEKIQGGRERIPESWAVHGTTGYRFLNTVSGVFVQPANEGIFTELYESFTHETTPFHELVYQKKKLILSDAMSSEVNVLARELNRISEMNRRTRDFTLNALRRGLHEFVALFPVYRTYVDGWRPELDTRDVRYIVYSIARAKERDRNTSSSLYDFLRDILLRRYPAHLEAKEREVMLRFAMKLQQLTGPVTAKGLEDTAFYIYNRLTSLNEVGGEPERFGARAGLFHERNEKRARQWPAAMLTTSTHDTKRSEDVRARINVLTEIPEIWRANVRRWNKANAMFKITAGQSAWPSLNDEYLFYQTLVGAWPMGLGHDSVAFQDFRGRLEQYMAKATKEAKVRTSWTNPNPRYDNAVIQFVQRTTDARHAKAFLDQVQAFVREIERPGQLNALGQLLLKAASPGVVDTYQGCELWDLSLVDPDNRRPVDFAERERLLSLMERERGRDRLALSHRLWASPDDGQVKLYVLTEALQLRARRREMFRRGDYLPILAQGAKAASVIAFARRHQEEWVVAVVPRWTVGMLAGDGLASGMKGTSLVMPDELGGVRLREVFTGRVFQGARLDLNELFTAFPLGLLEGPLS